MSHFSKERSRFEATPPAWLPIGGQLNELVNDWAARGDIITYIGEGAGGPAPACFRPNIAEMEINREAAFGEGIEPEFISDLRVRRNQFDYPVAMGAVLHEAMHARHSHWSLERLASEKRRDVVVGTIAELFEESRVEARGVAHYPKNRSFLRACALKLVMGDLEEEEILAGGAMGLSQLILLTCGRVDAGVLEASDVKIVEVAARAAFGDELFDNLRELWVKAQAHAEDTELEPLLELAEEWKRLLEEAGHETEPTRGEPGVPGSGGEGGGSPVNEAIEEILERMAEMAEDAEIEAREEGSGQIIREVYEQRAKDSAAEAREEREHRSVSEETFGKGTGPSSCRSTTSTLVRKRPPKPKERAAAVTVAQLLDKARYRDRVVVERSGQIPPGKLKTRAALQASVERSRGQVQTAEPWKSKRRYHTEDPELKVGVLVDISGSMGSAMEPMAVTAWMLSEAVRRIQGRAAMVYFGNGVFPVLKPGQHLPEVNVYSAPDGTERFNEAFKALDGSLNLLHGSGARLLVLVSDMCYTHSEGLAATKWLTRCRDAGVAVLVLPYDEGGWTAHHAGGTGAEVVTGRLDPAKAATEIGRAAARAIEKAGGRR